MLRSNSILLGFMVVALSTSALPSIRADEPAGSLDLFAAAEAGQIDLKVIPKNANQATIVIQNKSKQPLTIQLPETFVGVLAQPGIGVGGGGLNVGGGGGGAQAFGGGMGGMGGGMGGMGMGGMFNLGPDAVRRVRVVTVCLEHGKDDPKPKMDYVLQPLESFTSDQRVHQICKLLGEQRIDTDSAQAAIWHVTAGLTWQELAQKVKVKHLDGTVEMFFDAQQIAHAARIVQAIGQPMDHAGKPSANPAYPNY